MTDFPGFKGNNCTEVVEEWEAYSGKLKRNASGTKGLVLSGALKGAKRVFDEPCRVCDPPRAAAGKKVWRDKMTVTERFTEPAVLDEIRSRVRCLMGKGWYRSRSGCVVPTREGCLENRKGLGGSTTVLRLYDPAPAVVDCPRESERVDVCRLGVAKGKGKFRVVTMQSARAKRYLREVHECAYDRLSEYPWLVVGDVQKEDFLSVASDLKPGEKIVSGDYEASTDNLNRDAVYAVVDVLAEDLPPFLADMLRESFRRVKLKGKNAVEVLRGSMMGNLCSFVVLCLLNRVCYDMARGSPVSGIRSGMTGTRPVRINGDDIMFAGSDEMYRRWIEATSAVGFVINEEKTTRSTQIAELNSTSYVKWSNRILRRLCFGFLAKTVESRPLSVVGGIFDLAGKVSYATAVFILTNPLIQRKFAGSQIEPSQVPKRWRSLLVKRPWFRLRLLQGVSETGPERTVPMVPGPQFRYPSEPTFWPLRAARLRVAEEVARREISKEWRGKCPPMSRDLDLPKGRWGWRRLRLRWTKPRPVRMWVAPVLEAVLEKAPHWLYWGSLPVDPEARWVAGLAVVPTFFPPPYADVVPVRDEGGLYLVHQK